MRAIMSRYSEFKLQRRLLPAIPPDPHQIALLVREADFLLLPEADLFAVVPQSVKITR